jgi:quercetin dioxygenase-like cupin family protein
MMTVWRTDQATEHEVHGAHFSSYVAPSTGSKQLCAWQVRVAAGVSGQEHRVSHEEVFLVQSGAPRVVIDGEASVLAPGQVALVPSGAVLRLDNDGPDEAALWVTTSVGLTAQLADGSAFAPPWTR